MDLDPRKIGRRIRQLRDRRGLSQDNLADFAGRTGRWLSDVENGRAVPHIVEINGIALALRVDPLVVLCRAPIPTQLLDQGTGTQHVKARDGEIGQDEDDVNRRQFLKTGAVIALSPALDVRGRGVLDELEGMTRDYAQRSRIVPPALLLGPVEGHLQTFRRALGSVGKRRIYSSAGEAAVLVGRLAQYLDQWGVSHQALSWAQGLARESGDGTLMAHALGTMSGLHSGIPRGGRGGDVEKAISILNAAVLAAGRHAPADMRSWLLARRAEELAVAGRARSARRDLDLAARALAEVTRPDDGFFRHLSAAWLGGYRGNCERLLRQPGQAVEALEGALQSISPAHASSRSGVLADLAAAYAMGGDGDHAAGLLTESLELASRSGVTVARERILGIRRHELAGCANSAAVRQLDELLGGAA